MSGFVHGVSDGYMLPRGLNGRLTCETCGRRTLISEALQAPNCPWCGEPLTANVRESAAASA